MASLALLATIMTKNLVIVLLVQINTSCKYKNYFCVDSFKTPIQLLLQSFQIDIGGTITYDQVIDSRELDLYVKNF